MTSSQSEELGCLVFVAIIGIGIWLIDWVPFRQEVAIYQANCSAQPVNDACPAHSWVAGKRMSFKPVKETKTVVYWEDGVAPSKYDNCAIVDAENWSCSDIGESVDQMVGGVFAGLPRDGTFTKSVSKWEWWLLKLKKA